MDYTRLRRFGLLSVTGEDARDFLHAQLTNDIQNLPSERAALAGWCSPKGRLLASFLVIPAAHGFLLQLARDLTPVVAKRLTLFVLRSKVKIADESDKWSQLGIWGEIPGLDAPRVPLGVGRQGSMTAVRMAEGRTLILATEAFAPEGKELDESRWTLEEIRTGRPLITSATQDLFIPQMVNLHTLGGVDFRKGCYPGQEIVARTQYRGQVKRHMVHARVADGTGIGPGAAFGEGGTVVNAAPGDDGTELLAVVPIPQE